MRSFFLLLILLAAIGAGPVAQAQKIIEKTARLVPGQRVFLNLRQASNIRIRPGAPGHLSLKATVSINQNRLNEALLVTLESGSEELKMTADFDREVLRQARPGDCPGTTGDRNMWFGQQICDEITYEITLPADVALRVYSYSGNVDIAGLTGAMEVKTLAGFVDVDWPAAAGAEVALKTITGEVYTDQDIAFSTARRLHPVVGYQLQGTLGRVGGGGPLVKLESVSNDVYFRKRR